MSLPRQRTNYTWQEILQKLDIGQLNKCRSSINLCLERCKEMIISCRRASNDTGAAELSQIKEDLKKLGDRFCRCGSWKHRHALNCSECARNVRNGNNYKIPDNVYNRNMVSSFGHSIGSMNLNGTLHDVWLIAFKQ